MKTTFAVFFGFSAFIYLAGFVPYVLHVLRKRREKKKEVAPSPGLD
jgi:hypothetical protein